MNRFVHSLTLSLALFFIAATSFAQSSQQTTITAFNETGMHPFGAYDGIREDISLTTGNLHMQIPLLTFPGRGMNFALAVDYDSKGAMPGFFPFFNNQYTIYWLAQARVPVIGPMRLSVPTLGVTATACQGLQSSRLDWIFTDWSGSEHHFGYSATCASFAAAVDSDDSAFMRLDATNQSDFVVRMKDGTSFHFNGGFTYLGTGGTPHVFSSIVDTNGNTIQSTLSGGVLSSITDTVGRVYSFDFTNNKITYKDANGVSQSIIFTKLTDNSGGPINYAHPTASECTGGTFTLGSLHGGPGPNTTWAMTIPSGAGVLTYQFQFDAVGELIKVTYPSGGYTKYDYQALAATYVLPASSISCSPVDFREVVAKHECRRSDGNCGPSPAPTPEDTTSYLATASTQANASMDVLSPDPSGTPNKTHYDFSLINPYAWNYASLELDRYVYSGSTVLLRTINTDYTQISSAYYDGSLPIRITTTLNDISPNLVSKVETDYDTALLTNKFDSWTPTLLAITNPIEVREFDYGLVLNRKTDMTWLKTGEYALAQKHIMDRSLVKTVFNGAGTQVAQTTNEYDNYTEGITASGATQLLAQDSFRGNLTAVSRWLNPGGTLITTRRQYDDAGNVRQVTDPLSHSTTFSFTDSWFDNSCAPASGQAAAYATSQTNALNQSSSVQYDSCSGLPGKTIDVNLQPTTFAYDTLGRKLSVTYPDGGLLSISYNDVAPRSQTATRKITTGLNFVSMQTSDGLGRIIQSQLQSDPEGATFTDTTYDTAGRISTVSNPYRSVSDSTYGITTTQYDALNRVTKLIPPDGTVTANSVTTSYLGNCTTITDQAAKARKSCTDALGRMLQVFEDPAGLNYETDYTYDALDNLLTVNQKGGTTNSALWRTRTFNYDSLSSLLCASNPENSSAPCPATATSSYITGTTGFSYDANGNMLQRISPAPNQTGTTPVTISYCYDSLDRITGKAYIAETCSGGLLPSPLVSYYYDQSSYNGLTTTNGKGRRTGMADQAGTEAWSYDSMGRPLVDQRTTNSLTKSTTYVYLPYVDGSVNTITYPSGRTLTYNTGGAERPLSVQDSTTSVYYASAAHYAPPGGLSSLTNGAAIYSTKLYNSRLQPCWLYATTGTALPANTVCTASDPTPGNVLDLNYNFNFGSTDNGNVMGITNNRSTTRSQTFAYDSLNRIATAESTSTYATSPANCWGESYFFDNNSTTGQGAWGNLTSTLPPSSAYNGCVQESNLSVSVSPNNQLSQSSNFCYDSAGNLVLNTACPTGSFTPAYSFDAENHLISTAGVNYVYDGDGRRVYKSNGKLYWYGAGDDTLAETDGSGNTLNEYVFFDGKRVALISATGGTALPVQNASFEIANAWTNSCGTNCNYNGGPVPDWTFSGTGGEGSFEPNSSYFNLPLPDGNIVASLNAGSSTQTLTGVTFLPNTTYTLSVYVGHRLDGYVTNYTVALQAGSTVLNSVSGSSSTITTGDFAQVTVTYTTGSTPPSGYVTIVLTSAGSQSNFDKVTLTSSGGGIYYYFEDMLGTSRGLTQANGTVCYDADFYPFGGERAPIVNTCSQNYKFTGKERDVESGLDNFGARYNSPSIGRFMSPDPDNISGLMNQDDPQSWDGYTYARNNPLRYTDPDGANYLVCDQDGNNCAKLTQEQYDQYLASIKGSNTTVSASGQIQIQNDNGSSTTIGQSTYYNEKDVAAAKTIGQFAEPIEDLGLAEFIILGPYAGPALLGTVPEVGLTGVGLGAAGLAAGSTGQQGPEGPSSSYADVTKPGSKPPNASTNMTAKEFGENLEAQGYTKSQRGDVTIYTRGGKQYTVYQARSTGGPSAQVSVNGIPVGKIRLQQ